MNAWIFAALALAVLAGVGFLLFAAYHARWDRLDDQDEIEWPAPKPLDHKTYVWVRSDFSASGGAAPSPAAEGATSRTEGVAAPEAGAEHDFGERP